MYTNLENRTRRYDISKLELRKILEDCVKGHIEVTESDTAFHIYITNNDYCCKVYYSYLLTKDELNLQTAYSLVNKVLNNYKTWINEKLFH